LVGLHVLSAFSATCRPLASELRSHKVANVRPTDTRALQMYYSIDKYKYIKLYIE